MEAVLDVYEAPVLADTADAPQSESWIWVVFTFSYLAALAWAAYCRYTGGDANIEFTWRGFKVTCTG